MTDSEGAFTEEDSNAMRAAAKDKIMPVLRDAVTWLLHERGMNFTPGDRMGATAGVLTALTIQFIIEAGNAMLTKCQCDECMQKAHMRAAAIYVSGLLPAIKGHVSAGEVEIDQ